MIYRSVGNRCAIDLSTIPHLSSEEALARFIERGFRPVEVNIVRIAQDLIKTAVYKRGARLSEAPGTFDCSGFVKWVYAQAGIWIPRRSFHQFAFGEAVLDDHLRPGDLVFTNGRISPPIGPPEQRVGHVGILCTNTWIAHATPDGPTGVVASTLDEWRSQQSWRGARRIIPSTAHIITLQIPPSADVETSDDAIWMILETLDWTDPS